MINNSVPSKQSSETTQSQIIDGELLFSNFNDKKSEYPFEKTIIQLFEEQVIRTPERIAASYEGQSITYKQLNQKASLLAKDLIEIDRHSRNVIGIMLDVSIEMLIALFGVLKSGSAYLPLDLKSPEARIKFILEDSNANIIISNESIIKNLSNLQKSFIDIAPFVNTTILENSEMGAVTSNISTNNLAYIIYTSGSTGTPKGVAVEHRNLVNYVWWAKNQYIENADDTFAAHTPLAFDLSITSILVPLISGNKIEIYGDTKDDIVLARILKEDCVDILKVTPTHLQIIKELKVNNLRLKRLIVGGEALNTILANKIIEVFGRAIEIYNEYGPTETVVGSIFHKFVPEFDKDIQVPIGTPISNTYVYLLDQDGHEVSFGSIGEIHIAGDGVTRGYINQPELTGKRFVNNPFLGNSFMYKTGDIAKMLPNGKMTFLGRIDDQVKIRGYRIELGELESALLSHQDIKEAFATTTEAVDNKQLIAYIVFKSAKDASEESIRTSLKNIVPEYMVPSYIIKLDVLPRTTHGKVDRQRLPQLNQSHLDLPRLVPVNEIESKLILIWQNVLEIKHISSSDNFFKLGGHSLKAMLLVNEIMKEFTISLPLSVLVNNPTIKQFAQYIEEAFKTNQEYELADAEQREYLIFYNNPQNQTRRNTDYENYYKVALKSKAHAAFCEKLYGKNFSQHGMADMKQLDILIQQLNLSNEHTALDVGCGYGLITEYIYDQTKVQLTGIDISSSAINEALRRVGENKKPLNFKRMDLQCLNFQENTFDAVISIDTIYFTKDLKATIKQMQLVTKPKGKLAIFRTFPLQSFSEETWNPDITELASTLRELKFEYKTIDFTKEEKEHWIKKVKILEEMKKDFIKEGTEELLNFRYEEAAYEVKHKSCRVLFIVNLP